MYKLIISQGSDRMRAGVLFEDDLIEYHEYDHADREILGDIRLGQVQELIPGINAVFVNIGEEKPAFMPVGQEELTRYKPGQELLVQLQKAAVGEKGIVVTDHLSLTGRYVVLTPSNSKIGVSGKITAEEERERLKAIGKKFPQPAKSDRSSAEKVLPIGYILRTESQNQPENLLREEADRLYLLYCDLLSKARYSRIGDTLYSAGSALGKLILSIPAAQLEKIVLDNRALRTALENEISLQKPEIKERFQVYQDDAWNILDFYKISSRLEKARQKRFLLPDGGYLFIEETEALSVIDVNTGKQIRKEQKEAAVTAFNLKTIPYIVQQILLRNLSGIIIIDFIDMKADQHRLQVLEALKQEFAAKDRRKTQVLGFTRLGLMELSRERKGKSLSKQF